MNDTQKIQLANAINNIPGLINRMKDTVTEMEQLESVLLKYAADELGDQVSKSRIEFLERFKITEPCTTQGSKSNTPKLRGTSIEAHESK